MLGVIFAFVCYMLSYYTNYLVLRTSAHDDDFSTTLFKFLGPKGRNFGMIASFMFVFGASLVYF